MPSPNLFDRRFTAYRRTSSSTSGGGIQTSHTVVKRNFAGSIQSTNPSRMSMEFGAGQVFCSHRIFTKEDVSALQKEDWVRDEENRKEYVITFIDDVAGKGTLFRIDAWEK